jgi:hypothetical protein
LLRSIKIWVFNSSTSDESCQCLCAFSCAASIDLASPLGTWLEKEKNGDHHQIWN